MEMRPDGETRGAKGGGHPPRESQKLLLLAQAGDPAAFETLVRHHERAVLRLAFRMLGDLEEAKDAAQEVLVKFHRYLGRLDSERDPAPWLYQTTLNVCRDLAAKRRRFALVSLEEIPEPPCPSARDCDPTEGLDRKRRAGALGRALAILPEGERAALVLRDIEGFSAAEAARLLGSSETTVRSQACRARLRLRGILEGQP